MAALNELDCIIDYFEPMDKDSICSDHQTKDLSLDDLSTTNNSNDSNHQQIIDFDINSFEYMPCEKKLVHDFKQWMDLEFAQDKRSKQLRRDLHLKLLNAHPFVKAPEQKKIYDYTHHQFTVQKHMLNCRAFNVWCRKNRKWKAKAGGNTITDDGLYTVSSILRKLLPRGFHAIYVRNKDTNDTDQEMKEKQNKNDSKQFDDVRFFRGIPKFTGLVASDEDESSKSHENSSSFFYKNYTISDCTSFVRTTKSNGENCKLSVLSFGDIIYAVSGSKNTCEIWPIEEHSSKYFDSNILYPSGWISRIYSNWLLSLQRDDAILFQQFVREMSVDHEYIIMGEINEPWMEHIVPIHNMFIEVYTVLDNGSKDGLPIHCKKTFDLFNRYQMTQMSYDDNSDNYIDRNMDINVFTNAEVMKQERFMNAYCIKHVQYAIHAKNELNAVIEEIRKETASEGAVLYLLNKEDVVIGLCKVKASSYVVRRRIRERCRSKLFRPLSCGFVEGLRSSRSKKEAKWTLNQVRESTKEHLKKGMNKMSHVPNHYRLKHIWSEFAIGFVDWWMDCKLGKKKNVTHVDLVLLEVDQRFASLLQQYAEFKYKGQSPV